MPRATKSQRSSGNTRGSRTIRTTEGKVIYPIHPSSGDHIDHAQPRVGNASMPVSSVATGNHQQSNYPSMDQQPRYRPLDSYPTDSAALRELYRSKYGDYQESYAKVMEQKSRIDSVLNGNKKALAGLMEPEEVQKLAREHLSQRQELEYITELCKRATASRARG